MTRVLLCLIAACRPAAELRTGRAEADAASTSDTGATDTGTPETGTPDTDGEPDDGCPTLMAAIDDFCIDRYEATLAEWSPYEVPSSGVAAVVASQVPQAHISGDVAADACEAAGKRLCALSEWMRACQGPSGWTWPYGDTYQPGACNDAYDGHPLVDYYGTSDGIWDMEHMNDPGINQQPGTVARGGEYTECVSAEGVYDLHGNLHEWIDDPNGTFKGGFYADASINGPGCTYTTTAHGPSYYDYSTGFRCCADAL